MQGKRVLLVEDDRDSRRVIQGALEHAGALVATASSTDEAINHLEVSQSDLLIVAGEVALQGDSTFCRHVTTHLLIPILLVRGLEDDQELMRAISLGVADFVNRPVNIEELLTRARLMLQRAEEDDRVGLPSPIYEDSYLRFDLGRRRVHAGGQPVRLTAREFDLLAYLHRRAGRVCTLEQILENVWGWECRDNREYVHAYVSRLRHKIEPDPGHPTYVRTEYGIGYYFEPKSRTA